MPTVFGVSTVSDIANISGLLALSGNLLPLLGSAVVLIFAYFFVDLALRSIRKNMLKRAKSKKQVSNVEIFYRLIKYSFVLLLLFSAIFYYSGSLTGLGLTVGLISAALGLALQKPITGLAAWVMIITRRPFEIGDRISIGALKGDVKDITLTHVYLNEVGGMVDGEDNSGRVIMVPNSGFFEQHIINYTHQDDIVLNEVKVSLTYEGNLDRGMKLILEAGKKHLKDFAELHHRDPFVRVAFEASSVRVSLRYFVPAKKISETESKISKEIFDSIKNSSDVEFAYPHVESIVNYKTEYLKRVKGHSLGEFHPKQDGA